MRELPTPKDLYVARWLMESGAFDRDFYLRENPDVVDQGIDAAVHFVRWGVWEGRRPNPGFDLRSYLSRYPELSAQGLNPLVHYLAVGRFAAPREPPPAPPTPEPQAGHRVTEFLLQHAIEPNGEAFGYRATSNDPQLLVQRGFPAGFCRVRIQLRCSDLPTHGGVDAHLQLYIGDADGFREANSWRYPIRNGEVVVDDVLFNPKDVAYIRFDPLNTTGSFVIYLFELTPLAAEAAGPELTRRLAQGLVPETGGAACSPTPRELVSLWMALARTASSALRSGTQRYERWVAAREITPAVRAYLEQKQAGFAERPVISVLMPTFKPQLKYLLAAIESVRRQVYGAWELCVVDDGSKVPQLRALLQRLAAEEPRIKLRINARNAGIAAATNDALALATGTFVALLDHDDELQPHALHAVAAAIDRAPEADFLYSDEDKITESGERFGPFFKPDWSPDFMFGCMYTCHLGVYRTALVREVGGFRPEFDFAQDYDLALRVAPRARRILHIPDVLYSWRTLGTSTASSADAKPTAELAARRAVAEAVRAGPWPATVGAGPIRGTHRLVPTLRETPLISIVIPTAARRIAGGGARWYLLDLLRSIREKTTYPKYELVIVHNGDVEPLLDARLAEFRPRMVHYAPSVFNISDKMNLGVAKARGKYVVLLNDDMTVITPDWLSEMLMWMADPGVAGVGAKLLFPDDTVQHAGVAFFQQGPSHVYYGVPADEPGLAGGAVLARTVSAVTGACMMVRRAQYRDVGGFDPAFRVNYNDVDFCLRLGRLGRIVQTPFAQLYHYESVSKDVPPPDELTRFNARWPGIVGADPFHNRNLSQVSSTMEIVEQPRSIQDDY